MGTMIRHGSRNWSWAAWITMAIVLAGCGPAAQKRAPETKSPAEPTAKDVPSAVPDGSGTEQTPLDADVEPHAVKPTEAKPPRELPKAPSEPKPRPRLYPGDRDNHVPEAPPTRSRNERPDDPVQEDAPVLMRIDEQPDTVQPLEPEEAAAPDADDPDAPFDTVTVFYATDRRRLDAESAAGTFGTRMLPILVGVCLVALLVVIAVLGWQRRRMVTLAGLVCLLTILWGIYAGRQQLATYRAAGQRGVRYGNERGTLEMGTCQVSIPWAHEVGQVEQPSILRLEVRENVRKHVVLHETNDLEQDAFYHQLRDTVTAAPRPEVFVFVHGYNVTFEGAARRTAQIAYDVQFAGAPIFFSWPSQGGLLKYTVDENNVEWAVPHLKQLLLDVVRRSGAKSVNLIAHSMGNRALTAALRDLQRELGEESALFNQIILAAPDIDAEIFCRDLAPALTNSSKRVTLYASSNDQALAASKKVHGYVRAGESGPGMVVIPGVETVDVSMLDTNLLGHSYYGSSNPILADMRQLIEFALPAAQRHWLLPKPHGELTYWVFEKAALPAGDDGGSL